MMKREDRMPTQASDYLPTRGLNKAAGNPHNDLDDKEPGSWDRSKTPTTKFRTVLFQRWRACHG